MIFKADWEKTETYHHIEPDIIQGMIALAFPNKKISSQKRITDGCANINIKISSKAEEEPVILRIYVRDPKAAVREQKLALLLKPEIPIPAVYYIGDYANYRFAITEFMPGITLRDLLLSDQLHDLSAIMFDVGLMLSKIANYKLPANLNDNIHNNYLAFALNCLTHKTVIQQLGTKHIAKLHLYLNANANFFPDQSDQNLVHADFDPSNILVVKAGAKWQISGVLDWEFAFSGSTLCDVANMLRYAHKMPLVYADSFNKGLKKGGKHLPDNWQISIKMLNLLSLLDCMVRADPQLRPRQSADICALIHAIC